MAHEALTPTGLSRPTRLPRQWLAVVLAVATALVLAVGGGAAYGYFTSHGSGNGSGSTGSMQTVTVAAISGQTPNTLLQPGSSGEVIVNVHNPNNFQTHLVSVTFGTISVSGGSGCTAANSGVTLTNQPTISVAIPASSTTLVRLPGAASISTSSNSGCQGATFSATATITVHTP
jgi:hypothetical protein